MITEKEWDGMTAGHKFLASRNEELPTELIRNKLGTVLPLIQSTICRHQILPEHIIKEFWNHLTPYAKAAILMCQNLTVEFVLEKWPELDDSFKLCCLAAQQNYMETIRMDQLPQLLVDSCKEVREFAELWIQVRLQGNIV